MLNNIIIKLLRFVFHWLVVKPFALLVLGIQIDGKENLPQNGPAIICANHNSHLDIIILLALLPNSMHGKIRPVAAADYFPKKGLSGWFLRNILRLILIHRKPKNTRVHPLEEILQALKAKELVIIFPEGTRGNPEHMSSMKNGIAHILNKLPHVPSIPIFMYGLGKALPKGEAILVPFICDICVGKAIYWKEDRKEFMQKLSQSMLNLSQKNDHKKWE